MSMVLTLDSNGLPNQWKKWKSAVRYQAKNMVIWSSGEFNVTFRGGRSKITDELSVITVPSIIAIKGKCNHNKRIPSLNNKNLFRRDLFICAYCGRRYNEDHLTKDHIIPVSRGGLNTWTNCVTACKKCNNKKDNLLLHEFGAELLYVPYVPDRAERLILENRKILADQMEFLVAYLPKTSRAMLLM